MLNDLNVFLLDMDGTVYLGDTLIDGAKDFLDTLKSLKKNYIFVTNNSSKSPKAYIEKLYKLGINVKREQIFTSADATIIYLKEHNPDIKNIFLLGTPSLKEQFLSYDYNIIEKREELNELFKNKEKIDEIILGFDTTLTYEKMHTACDLIREKGSYIATHPDLNCPLNNGKMMPDIGAMIAFIKASTKIEPTIIGKPERTMIDGLCKKYNFDKKELLMIGDRLYTDILIGREADIKTALVFSGETTRAMYDNSNIAATYTYDSVKEIDNELRKFL